MSLTNEEKLELAKKCGAVQVYPGEDVAHTFSFAQLLAFAHAIEQKHQARIAMLRGEIQAIYKLAELVADYNILAICNSALSDTKQDTDAFIDGVKAGALEDAESDKSHLHDEDLRIAVTYNEQFERGWNARGDYLRRMAAKLRNSAAQPEGKERK